MRERTALSLLNDLDIAESCGSLGVVVHFGIHKGRDPLEGYRLMIATLDCITDRWDGSCRLLIENQAGNHGSMGMTLEELIQIRCAVPGAGQAGLLLGQLPSVRQRCVGWQPGPGLVSQPVG